MSSRPERIKSRTKQAFCNVISVAVPVLWLWGCSTTERHTINTTIDFNVGLQRALNQQLLLNLVRMRFREPALFLNPKHLSGEAKVTVSGGMGPSLEVGTSGGGATFDGLLPGFSGSREYRPTISFAHVSGESQHYHKEITMELLNHLLKAEWNVSVLLTLFVERLDDIKNDPRHPESYQQFREITHALETEQDAHGLAVIKKTEDETVLTYEPTPPPPPPPPEKGLRQRYAAPAEPSKPTLDLQFSLEELLNIERQGYSIDLSDEKLQVKKRVPVAYMIQSLSPEKENPEKGKTIVTRSFYDVLFFLAQAIDVPPALSQSVKSYGPKYEASVRELLTVSWNDDCPDHAYIATEYKGYCWYIADNMPSPRGGALSKDTISLLQMVYMLQGTDISGTEPVISVMGL